MAFTFLAAWLCWRWYKFRDRRKLGDEESDANGSVEWGWNDADPDGKGDGGMNLSEKA
jgi:hypothetical protein